MASMLAATAMLTLGSVSAVSIGERLIAACGSFMVTTIVTHPLDVIKTNLQVESSGKDKVPTKGALQMVSKLLRRDGIGGFYKGIGPSLMMAPGGMMQYAMYDELRKQLSPLPSAVLAGVVDITLKTPFELLKTQMQSDVQRRTFLVLLMQNIRNGGVISLWAGFSSMLARDVPYTMLKWVFFDACKTLLQVDGAMTALDTVNFVKTFAAGAIAACIAAIFVTPADVIKTRVQVGRANQGALTTARMIIREEGFFALFAGLSARLMRIPIDQALKLSLYDLFKGLSSTLKLA